jgi:hypothetical protein
VSELCSPDGRGTVVIDEAQLAGSKPRRRPKRKPPRGTLGLVAAKLLQQHPEWTDARVAQAVGCNRTSLYRLPDYQRYRAALREEARRSRPRGVLDHEGHIAEAWTAQDATRLR